jgi:hypothetical protein
MSFLRAQVPAESPVPRKRPNLLTLISVSVVAAAFADVVHEVLGHAIAAGLADIKLISISSVFVQTGAPNRFVAACGTLANLALGGMAALLLRGSKRFTPGWYFLWVFGCLNLMNSGYLLYSAISGTGDWAIVISRMTPPWLWRIALATAGILIYRPAVRFAVSAFQGLVREDEVAYHDLWRLVLTAYVSAGILLTTAAALNPVSRGLILIGGVGASFGLSFGMVLVPAFIRRPLEPEKTETRSIPFSWSWLIFAFVVAAAFIAGLGRGIQF